MQSDEYRKLAEIEDRMWYFVALHRRRAEWLGRLLPRGPARVLDAGCGTGGFIRVLRGARPDWIVAGVDQSPQACALARERTAAEILEGSVTALPYEDGSFDAVTTGDVLYHVGDPTAALREFARVLRSGGALVVNEPAYRWLWSYHDEAVGSKHRFTRGELTARFEAAGFAVKRAGYANLPALPLVILRRKIFPPAAPTSDVVLLSRPIEWALAGLAAMEFDWQCAGIDSPAGSSVFVAGRKRGVRGGA